MNVSSCVLLHSPLPPRTGETDFLCLLMCRPRRRLLEVEGGRVYSYSTGVDSRLYLPECHVNVTNRNLRLLRVRNYGYVYAYGVARTRGVPGLCV